MWKINYHFLGLVSEWDELKLQFSLITSQLLICLDRTSDTRRSALAIKCPAKPSYPGQALVDLCDLRYANDTISLHDLDCMQMLVAASAARHGVARPAHKADTVSLLCYASFDLLWMT